MVRSLQTKRFLVLAAESYLNGLFFHLWRGHSANAFLLMLVLLWLLGSLC